MRLRDCRLVLASIVVCAAGLPAYGAESAPALQTFTVSETYNKRPFEYRMKLLAERDGFRMYQVTYPSPVVTSVEKNNTIRANFYLPDNIKPDSSKRPAVVVLHILNGDMRATDVACSVLAMRGIPAIMPTLPYYGDRAKAEGWHVLLQEPTLFMEMLLQSVEDIRRTFDLLASRSEINPQRIDISGVSLGGIVAATCAGAEPRFYRTSLFLAGGDLMAILNHARYTRGLSERFRQLPAEERTRIEARVNAIDPLALAPALRERAQQGHVLMVNVAEDEIIPRACTEKLAAALGISEQVVWMSGHTHDTFFTALPEALQKITEFLAQDLPADVPPRTPAADPSKPTSRAAALLHQVLAMCATEPDPGRCHRLEMDINAGPKGQKPIETHVRFVRGPGERFALKCRLPIVGDVALGQKQFPWMVAGGKTVLSGVKNPIENRNPLSLADPRNVARLRVAGGLLGTLDIIPSDTLNQWVNVEDANAADGGVAVRITAREKFPGSVLIHFREDGKTPSEATFDAAGVSGKATVRGWQVNALAEDTTFNPPADLPVKEVDQADLYRMFATMFDLAMQRTN